MPQPVPQPSKLPSLRGSTRGRFRRTLPRRRGPVLAFLLTVLFVLPGAALAQSQSFPALTGRVVDAANLLKPDERASLEVKLASHEERTTHQVVVATVPSLGDLTVENYANQLFRQWGLGQKQKNNGVLLLVAPRERKVRIEVGYGLEGTLTDALSKIIITTAIAPRFQQNDFAGGIDAGVGAILSILTNDGSIEQWQQRPQVRSDDVSAKDVSTKDSVVGFIILLIILYVVFRLINWIRPRRAHQTHHSGWSSSSSSSWSSTRQSGGRFSGGGGSSGGGGASGSW